MIGVDLNDGMLAVARRLRPDIEWRHADAAVLPFPDGTVDVALCQAALMFFPDPGQTLREMARVITATGTVGIQVWSGIDAQVGWAPFYEVVRRHAGPDAIELISTYWRLGDLDALVSSCTAAGLDVHQAQTRRDAATFGSVEEFVAAEVTGTPLQERISESTYADIVEESRTALAPFRSPEGQLNLPIEGHILIAHPVAAAPGPANTGKRIREGSGP